MVYTYVGWDFIHDIMNDDMDLTIQSFEAQVDKPLVGDSREKRRLQQGNT